MNLQTFLTISGLVVGAILIIAYIINFVRLIIYEKKINGLHKECEDKIKALENEIVLANNEQDTRIRVNFLIENTKKEYASLIENVERKRRFLLDKLPLMKK